MHKFLVCLVAVIAALSQAGELRAAPINYGNFIGAAVGQPDFLDVIEDSTTDATPLFDAPFHTAHSLALAPIAFASSASNGASDTTVGSLTMTIRADAGFFLGRIIIDETGDTTLSGAGTNATFSSVSTAVEIEDLVPGLGGILNDNVPFAPGDLFELPTAFVDFNGNLVVDLSGMGVTEARFTLLQTLATGSELGTTAFIQSKTFQFTIESLPIPEPGSLAMLGLGAMGLLRRRVR